MNTGVAAYAAESTARVYVEDGRGNIVTDLSPDDARELADRLRTAAAYAELHAGPVCEECGESEDAELVGGTVLCPSCLHDAERSGWVPGE